MDTNQIVSRMNTYLNVAKGVLSEWLGSLLPQVSEDWWEECVLENLSYYQQEKAKEKGYTKLIDFDLAALLRVANKSWYAMRGVAYLPTRERECIRDLMGVRNNWAHMSTSLPGKDTVLDDLAILYLFFEQWKCDQKLLSEIIAMIAQIKEPTGEKKEELCKDDSVNVDNTRINALFDSWKGTKGLASDVRYYGEWMKKEAFNRIGFLYPEVQIPTEQGGGKTTAMAWIWARTVKCPNPACGCEMPLVRSFVLSKKKGHEAWIEPVFDNEKTSFLVHTSGKPKIEGTMSRKGGDMPEMWLSSRLSIYKSRNL